MEIKLTTIKVNPLLERKEISFEIKKNETPRRSDVRRELAVMLKSDLDQVWVREIVTKTGTHRSVGVAHVYDNAAKAMVVEPKYIIKRNSIPETGVEEGEQNE